MRLLTIPLSHFCEKARWGLDFAGLPYRERGYAPVVHKLAMLARGSSTVPLLARAPHTVRGSSAILEHANLACSADRALYPTDPTARREVQELVAGFDERLGPQMRLWLYSWALRDRSRLLPYASTGLTPVQGMLLRALQRPIVSLMAFYFKLTPRTHAEATQRIDEELALVSGRLADGRAFLVGERFSAADLTFAAFMGGAMRPPGWGGPHLTFPPDPAVELMPEVLRWRATPAGEFALALYRDWR